MKILIGVDDSACSRAALDFVKAAPWPGGCRFVVIAAAPSAAMGNTLIDVGAVSWLKAAEQDMLQNAEKLTERTARELREAGLAAEGHAIEGDPRHVLVELARDWGADLTVVGSHGRTGLDRLLTGSVASHVVAHAPSSVLVVKSGRPSPGTPSRGVEGALA